MSKMNMNDIYEVSLYEMMAFVLINLNIPQLEH